MPRHSRPRYIVTPFLPPDLAEFVKIPLDVFLATYARPNPSTKSSNKKKKKKKPANKGQTDDPPKADTALPKGSRLASFEASIADLLQPCLRLDSRTGRFTTSRGDFEEDEEDDEPSSPTANTAGPTPQSKPSTRYSYAKHETGPYPVFKDPPIPEYQIRWDQMPRPDRIPPSQAYYASKAYRKWKQDYVNRATQADFDSLWDENGKEHPGGPKPGTLMHTIWHQCAKENEERDRERWAKMLVYPFRGVKKEAAAQNCNPSPQNVDEKHCQCGPEVPKQSPGQEGVQTV